MNRYKRESGHDLDKVERHENGHMSREDEEMRIQKDQT